MRKTRTSQIEAAIADIFAIVDGHDGIDSDTIMEKMMEKGHNGAVVNDTINLMEETGAIAWAAGQWYINDENEKSGSGYGIETVYTEKSSIEKLQDMNEKIKTIQKESTMKKETTEKPANPIQAIIDGLKSGKKEFTLKQAKKDAARFGFTDTKNIKTKKDMTTYMTGCEIDEPKKQDKTIVVGAGVDLTETIKDTKMDTQKTSYQKKQDDILVSMVAVRDGIKAAINSLNNNTLKETKSDVYALLNTEARKHLSSDFITIITEANNCRVKKDYKSELRIALKELNSLIEQEHDTQEKDTVEISIPEKVKALTPDTAMLISQLDLKEKSRFDTLFNLLTEQDKKIRELSKLVSCHKDTINLLINRLQTVDSTNVSTGNQKSVKSPEKPIKTDEEIQIENRQAYIMKLKGIDKAIFNILTTQKRLRDTDFLIMEALEDYTPKMIKASLNAMVSNGLFDCTKNVYTIAPVSSFKDKTKTNKMVEKPASKKPTKKTFTRGRKNNTRTFIEGLIAQGKYTRKDIIEQAIEQGIKEGTVKTYIVDGKSEKYCKFNSLIKEDKKTKILSF